LSIFKVLLTLLFLLLISLVSYSLFQNNNYQKDKSHKELTHIKQLALPETTKSENEVTILSHLKQYIDRNKQYTDSMQTNENKILEELKVFISHAVSQEKIIKSIKNEGTLIKKELEVLTLNIDKKIDNEVKTLKKELEVLTLNIDKKIDNEVKTLKKDIKRNSNKINKKTTNLNKNLINKIEQTIGVFSSSYELPANEKSLNYGELETISTSKSYKIDDVAPIHSPLDVSTSNTNSIEELNFVQTLGVVSVSEPYLSTDELM